MTTARTRPPAWPGALRRFHDVLRLPGALGFAVPAAVARLGVAMTGLGLLVTVQAATGSYAAAGLATGTFAAAEGVAGPWTARLVDRCGQTLVVAVAVLVHGSAIVLAVSLAGRVTIPGLLALVVVAGAAVPQPGALSAARWSALVDDRAALRAAFSFEAVVNDVVFLSGPVLVAALGTTFAPWAGSAAAAMLLVGGCTVLVGHSRTAPPRVPRPDGGLHGARTSLLGRVVLGTLGVHVGLGCFFGAVPLVVTAAATAGGLRPFTGLVLACSSAASIVAGLVHGSARRQPLPGRVQFAGTAVLALAVGIGVLVPTLVGAAVMLAVGGLAIAPLVASSSQIVQATIPASERTQGFVWVNTASAVGIAGSAALTGTLLGASGVRAALVALLALVLGAVGAAAVALRPGPETRAPRPDSR